MAAQEKVWSPAEMIASYRRQFREEYHRETALSDEAILAILADEADERPSIPRDADDEGSD